MITKEQLRELHDRAYKLYQDMENACEDGDEIYEIIKYGTALDLADELQGVLYDIIEQYEGN